MHCKLKGVAKALATGVLIGAALVSGSAAYAQFARVDFTSTVKMPSAEYTEMTVDMYVKVLGGEVRPGQICGL